MAMNESVRQVAAEYLSGRELTEPLLNNLEVAIRAYDPCLSCATHVHGGRFTNIAHLLPCRAFSFPNVFNTILGFGFLFACQQVLYSGQGCQALI